MRYLRIVVSVVIVAVGVVCRAALPAPPSHASDAAVEAQCKPYYHAACNEAMGRWLPRFGYSSDWWDRATHIDKRDGFVYGYGRRSPGSYLGFVGPSDGTFFVYGGAGPPKGHAVYDRVHRVAFYTQGCCSWNDVVAAADAPLPPERLVAHDLRKLATVRGVRLWQTEAELTKIYGKSMPQSVPGHRGVSVLAYTTWPARSSLSRVRTPCGQFENFFFREHRLVLIQLGNGC